MKAVLSSPSLLLHPNDKTIAHCALLKYFRNAIFHYPFYNCYTLNVALRLAKVRMDACRLAIMQLALRICR